MPDEIVLDRQTFKALAADSRVSLLKSLAKRRKTGAELAKEFSLSASTVKEHLDGLEKTSLVRRAVDSADRKWKYYELTEKGRKIVEPSKKAPAQIWIVLLVCILAVAIAFQVFQPLGQSAPSLGARQLADSSSASSQPPSPAMGAAEAGTAGSASQAEPEFKITDAKIGIANNPASAYCEQKGYKLEIRDTPTGQQGVCVFGNGSECEEWQYFRGQCQPANSS